MLSEMDKHWHNQNVRHWLAAKRCGVTAGFSLIEMLMVVVLVALVVGVGVSMLNPKSTGPRDAGEQLASLVDQARMMAISKRKSVALVVASPDVLGKTDDVVRAGLFELDDWSEESENDAVQIENWHPLPEGVMIFPGPSENVDQLLDAPEVSLRWQAGANSAAFPGVVISPRGQLVAPSGAGVIELATARGFEKRGKKTRTSEERDVLLHIGRATARAWVMDGREGDG